MNPRTHVLVLGGGPDAEHDVSVLSATAVAEALGDYGRYEVTLRIVERVDDDSLRALPGDVVFPVFHGKWGEGGPLQDLLEGHPRPFVGSGSLASRLAMDKIATKSIAQSLGIVTPEVAVLDLNDAVCPLPFPVVVKPVHEGSTIGLHLCREEAEWPRVRRAVEEAAFAVPNRIHMVERLIAGRELTVGLLDGEPLPVLEIRPANGLYDYNAKYERNDTVYIVDPPDLAGEVKRGIQDATVRLAERIGVRHLARADFMLPHAGGPAQFLEINTMPGFTGHSLTPKAAAHRGIKFSELCGRLVDLALRDARAEAPPLSAP